MKKIFFPIYYKNLIKTGKKNLTIRVSDEVGRYKKGLIYRVFSYDGKDLGFDLIIKEIFKSNINELDKFFVKQSIINSLKKKYKLSNDSIVEVLRFKIIK